MEYKKKKKKKVSPLSILISVSFNDPRIKHFAVGVGKETRSQADKQTWSVWEGKQSESRRHKDIRIHISLKINSRALFSYDRAKCS